MSGSGEPGEGQLSRDRDTIREWAEQHDAVPVRESTETGEPGRFRMVPEGDLGESQERLEWNAFFDELDTGEHIVVYHGEEATEPLEVAGHEDVLTRVEDEEIEDRLLEGETVTSTIRDTAIVETVVVEELTVESELVETDIVDDRVTDAELLGRECTRCEVVEDREADPLEQFDADRYLSSTAGQTGRAGGSVPEEMTRSQQMTAEERSDDMSMEGQPADEMPMEKRPGEEPRTGDEGEQLGSEAGTPIEMEGGFPYHVELDVEETWAIDREFVERHTVESELVDSEITEAETIEDHDFDVSGLHRTIVESGVIERELAPEDVLAEYEIESELGEAGLIHTSFVRDRFIKEQVAVRKHLRADVTEGELLDMEVVHSEPVGAADGSRTGAGGTGEAVATERAGSTGADVSAGTIELTEDEVGKSVVDAMGEEVGLVTDVEVEANTMFVETTPGVADRIQAALGWGGGDEDDYRLRIEQVANVTDDEIELKPEEHLSEGDR